MLSSSHRLFFNYYFTLASGKGLKRIILVQRLHSIITYVRRDINGACGLHVDPMITHF